MTLTRESFRKNRPGLDSSTWPIDVEPEEREEISASETFESDNKIIYLWSEIEGNFTRALSLMSSSIRKGTPTKYLFKRSPSTIGRDLIVDNRSIGFFVQAGLLDKFDFVVIRDVKYYSRLIGANRGNYDEWRLEFPKLSPQGKKKAWVDRVKGSILTVKAVSASLDLPDLIGRGERVLLKLKKITNDLRSETACDDFAKALDPNVAMRKGSARKGLGVPNFSHNFTINRSGVSRRS